MALLLDLDSKLIVPRSRRVTILLDGTEEDLNESVFNDDGKLTLKQVSGHVQDKISFSSTEQNGSERANSRFTWKRDAGVDLSAIKSQFLAGFNAFTDSKIAKNGFVDTPVGKSYYNATFNIDVLKQFVPVELAETLQQYSENNDLDIFVSESGIQVERYYDISEDTSLAIVGQDSVRTEAGIFYVDTEDEDDTSLSGIRCTWQRDSGKIERCQKTLLFFQQPHQNKSVYGTVPINLIQPVNLHPNIQIDLSSQSPIQHCEYYAYLNLPRTLFIDQFQSSPKFLFGESDLEMPEFKVSDSFGSLSLFQLTPGRVNDITIHSRYIKPAPGKPDHLSVEFSPHVFYVCEGSEGTTMNSPFSSRDLSYETFFTPDTRFYHLNSTSLNVPIPKLDSSNSSSIQLMTLGMIILSFGYLLRKIVSGKNS